jgi:hypothetical protein
MRCASVFLLVLSLLGAAQADGQETCLEFDADLVAGIPVEIVLEDEIWLDPSTSRNSVYCVEVEPAEAMTLELFTTWSEWDPNCRHAHISPITTTDGAILEWTSPTNDAIHLVRVAGDPLPVRITMTELASPPGGTVLTIPVVAHLAGMAGTFFRTDLRVFNPEPRTVEVTLAFTPSITASEETAVVSLGPQEILRLDDVVSTIFGHDAARGSLQLRMASPHSAIRAISRTYNSTASGTYGEFIEAERWRESSGSFGDTTRFITHLAKSDAFRSNVGFVEVIGVDADLELELVAADGSTATGSITVPAATHLQINDVFDALGAEPASAATLVVRQVSEARVFAYGSVVDNLSSDPIYSRGVFPEFGTRQLVIPAAASNPGAFGTRWRTDLRVVPGAGASSLTATFYPTDGLTPVVKGYLFRYGREIVVNDVVADMGAGGTGALWLETPLGRLAATSRTYNLTGDGTFGQFIPAESRFAPTAVTAIGVDKSADKRTNIGLFNPWDSDSTVTIGLISDQGSLLGSQTLVVGSRRHHQINDIFRALGVAPRMNCRVDLRGEPLGVLGYASVIDNHTGDAIYVPARPIRDFQ